MPMALSLKLRRCLLRLILVACWLPAAALAGNGLQSLRFELLGGERSGLQAVISSAQQDSRGLMWLGSSAGLYRFDGLADDCSRRSRPTPKP